MRCPHKTKTRITDQRCAGIGYQRNGSTARQGGQQRRHSLGFVVIVQRYQFGAVDTQMSQQTGTVPRILSGYNVRRAQG